MSATFQQMSGDGSTCHSIPVAMIPFKGVNTTSDNHRRVGDTASNNNVGPCLQRLDNAATT
jgi:hypothetical protein